MQIITTVLSIFCLILMIVGCVFITKIKKQKAEIEKIEEQKKKMESDKQFQEEKERIITEVFRDAKEQKKSVNTGTDTQRYTAAASILHNNKRD